MKRSELDELHYITPIANIPSIMKLGILSHARAEKVQHTSVALALIQERRSKVTVPGGRPLHEYVNLYFSARNPMLYLRKDEHAELCVLRVDLGVIDLPGVVVTSANASGDYVRFGAGANGLAIVDRVLTFADYWTDPDPIAYWQKKAAKCAEVLVPDVVPPKYIMGAYVSGAKADKALKARGTGIDSRIAANLFFQ